MDLNNMASIPFHQLSTLPYVCRFCSKGYRQLSLLQGHTRLHTGQKPFICQQCYKTFRLRSQLHYHERKHADDNLYYCSNCSASFTHLSERNLHLIKSHKLLIANRLRTVQKYIGRLKCKALVQEDSVKRKSDQQSHPASKAAKHHCKDFKSPREKQEFLRTRRKRSQLPNLKIKPDDSDMFDKKVRGPKVRSYSESLPDVRVELIDCAMPKLERQQRIEELPVLKHKDSSKRPKSPGSPRWKKAPGSPRTYRTEPISTDTGGLKLKLTSTPESPRSKTSSPKLTDIGTPGIKLKLKLNFKQCECVDKLNCTCGKSSASIIESQVDDPAMDPKPYNSGVEESESFPSSSHAEQNNNVDAKPALTYNDVVKLAETAVSDAGSESAEEGDMPDDLSRHSPAETADCISVNSESPPCLTRIPSEDSIPPPLLPKVCCPETKCHHRLGDLGLPMECPCSPKVTGISPQYTVREEATSVGHGSPPSDMETNNTNKTVQSPQAPYDSLSDEEAEKNQAKQRPSQLPVPPKVVHVSPPKPPVAPVLKPKTPPSGFFDAFANFLKQKEQEEFMEIDDEEEMECSDLEKEDKSDRLAENGSGLKPAEVKGSAVLSKQSALSGKQSVTSVSKTVVTAKKNGSATKINKSPINDKPKDFSVYDDYDFDADVPLEEMPLMRERKSRRAKKEVDYSKLEEIDLELGSSDEEEKNEGKTENGHVSKGISPLKKDVTCVKKEIGHHGDVKKELEQKPKVKKERTDDDVDFEPTPGTSHDVMDGDPDDKYNLRHVRPQNHHSHFDCDCCIHGEPPAEPESKPTAPDTHGKTDLNKTPEKQSQPKPKSAQKRKFRAVCGKPLAIETMRVFHLRSLVCELFQIVFPDLLYPPRFYKDTHAVEALIDQIVCAVSDKDIMNGLPQPPGGASPFDVQVIVCKSPRMCLHQLRRKIMCLLKIILPEMKVDDSFDKTGRNVDKLLEIVVSRNRDVACTAS